MQNAGIAEIGLNWRYLAFEVHPDNLRPAIEGAKTMGFVGLNLTVPHKLLAFELMDVLDETAKTWGAVNTIRFEGRGASGAWLPLSEFDSERPERVRMHGFNTDADALIRSLREDLSVELRGARTLLLGVGGAGRVAALKLATEGVAEIFIINRTHSKAASVAAEIRRRNPDVKIQIGYPRGEVDLAINATSLGMKSDDPLPLDSKQFSLRQAHAAYDVIYTPAESAFLNTAKTAGCRTANGLGMLLYQGAKALEIWSGRPAPIETMRKALKEHIYGS